MYPLADISDIIPSPEEDNSRFLQIKNESKKLESFECKSFVKVFYGKSKSPVMLETMRQLLDQRTNLCIELQLSSKKSNQKQKIDKDTIAQYFSSLFFDCPDNLNQFSWAIIQDKATVYGFLATQNKFIPLCKICNYAVCASIRLNCGRIVCGNPKCKLKLLGQFEIGAKNKVEKKEMNKSQLASSHAMRKSEVLEAKNIQIQLGIQDKELIRKAAKRLVN